MYGHLCCSFHCTPNWIKKQVLWSPPNQYKAISAINTKFLVVKGPFNFFNFGENTFTMKYLLFLTVILLTVCSQNSYSQSLSVNTTGTAANISSILDVSSTSKGMLIPRMTTAQKTAITTPATGLQVYDTDLNQFYFYNGTAWTAIPTGANANNYWTLSGGNIYNNTGTNVGIGATVPLAKLTVEGTDDAGPQDLFKLSKSNYGSTIFSQYYTDAANFGTALRGSSGPVNAFTFNVISARFGIGTATPGDNLEVNGNFLLSGTGTIYTGAGQTNMTIHSGDGTGTGGTMTIRGGNAGIASGGAGGDITIQAGANLPSGGAGYGGLGSPGVVNIYGSYGYNSVGGGVNITAGQSSYWSTTGNVHSDVIISGGQDLNSTDFSVITVEGGHTYTSGNSGATKSDGGNLILKSGLAAGAGTSGNIELLNGNVGIGCTSPAYKLHVIGDIASSATVRSTNVVVTGAISACSDIRYKTNITELTNPMQKLMQLNGVSYYWKTAEFPNMNFSNKRQIGFIAQDVEKIFPEMVFTDDAGYKSIDYSRLTPVLVETIKEQQRQILAITKRMSEIEKMVHK